jgi:rhodanese-related sulfurtransferase
MTRSLGWRIAIVLISVLVLSAGCARPETATPEPLALATNERGYVDIDVEQWADMVGRTDVTVVNVHVPYEGDLPQTDLSIPYDQIGEHLGKLPDKDARIVLYCRSGSMSTSAAAQLAELGYTNVMELDGGMQAWVASGRGLVAR